MSDFVVSELAPHGVLRAGINLSNTLLVTGRGSSGDPEGVAPDLARAIASGLDVPVGHCDVNSVGQFEGMSEFGPAIKQLAARTSLSARY